MLQKIKNVFNQVKKLVEKLDNSKWYVKMFIGSWVSLYTSVIIWLVLTSWNPALYEGEILKLVGIYSMAILGYIWLSFVWIAMILNKRYILISFSVFCISILFVLGTFAFITVPFYNTIQDIKVRLNNNEILYFLTSSIIDSNYTLKKHNIYILNDNMLIDIFFKECIASIKTKGINYYLLQYNWEKYQENYKAEDLFIPEFNVLNKIMLNKQITSEFTNSSIILLYYFINNNYLKVCRYRNTGIISKDYFENASLPVRYFVQEVKKVNMILYQDIINSWSLACFYNKK